MRHPLHWKTTTFLAGMCSTGIVAPLVLDGPMTGEAFLAYTRQFLAPERKPGDFVAMDNLAAHEVARIGEAVRAAGASISSCP